MFKSILTSFIILSSMALHAATIEISRVTSDQDSDVTILYATTDADNVLQSMQQKIFSGGKVIANKIYSLDNLKNGVTLNEQQGYKIVTLKVLSRFEPIYGGPVQMDYLNNAISGKRIAVPLEFVLEGTKWKLKKNGKTTTKMHVSSNKILGKVVGIDSIIIQ